MEHQLCDIPTHISRFHQIHTPLFDLYYILKIITFENQSVWYMDRQPYDIQAAVSQTHTYCFGQIQSSLFDLLLQLEIITFGNYNDPDAGPQKLLAPYILSLLNANGPTGGAEQAVCIEKLASSQYLNFTGEILCILVSLEHYTSV